jgi:tetratricopeptide (TPR) repeat protein
MRPFLALACPVLVIAGACQRPPADTQSAKPPPSTKPELAPTAVADPAAFHLEIGGVYERFGDPKTATDHFVQAVGAALDPSRRVLAYSALARVKENGGDRAGAIDALEQALATIRDPKVAGVSQAGQPGLAGPASDDVVFRLARLYESNGAYEQARALCDRALSAAREPWQREQLYQLEVEVLRKSGRLEKEVAEREKAIDAAVADESALRFLAVALDGVGMQGPVANGGPPQGAASSGTLTRVYKRLHRLHPADSQIRQRLQSLLEQAGNTEEAVKLAAAPAPLSPAECDQEFAQLPVPASLAAAATAVRIRWTGGQKEKAVAETKDIVKLSKREGIVAYLVAAQLYVDQGEHDRATALIDRAARQARSREEQRQVAYARERQLERSGRVTELNAIHARWKNSDDECLQLAAAQRDRTIQLMAGALPTAMPGPRP